MDGIVYLLNQAGIAISQAEAQIIALTKENEQLRAALVASGDSPEANGA